MKGFIILAVILLVLHIIDWISRRYL